MAETIVPGPAWIPAFLEALAETRKVGQSAKLAGVHDSTIYKQRERNEAFADAWTAALDGHLPQAAILANTEGAPGAASKAGWQKPFLAALAETSNVRAAAKKVNVPLSTIYSYRASKSKFARDWEAALYEGYVSLEMELLGYLRDPDPGYKMDVANALRLLAAHKETAAREKARRGKRDKDAVLASLTAKLEKMRQRKAAAQRLLAEDGIAGPEGA